MDFSDEQLRIAVNLRQFYEIWKDAFQRAAALKYRLSWKERNGRFYLYKIVDRHGNGTSMGPKNEETERMLALFTAEKTAITTRESSTRIKLAETARQYRAVRLGMISSEAARLLQHLDLCGVIGNYLMVIGTNAMAAYELEAGSRFALGMDSTEDCDLAWAGHEPMMLSIARAGGKTTATLFDLLRDCDATYTINTERTFQARNAAAYEVELLVAPSLSNVVVKAREPLCPIPMPEQEWLLLGTPVEQVVCGRDATPARIVAPDPRYFALQKLWLADQPKRNGLKRPKDLRQGLAVLDAVADKMPQYPLDMAFQERLPEEVRPYFDHWQRTRIALP